MIKRNDNQKAHALDWASLPGAVLTELLEMAGLGVALQIQQACADARSLGVGGMYAEWIRAVHSGTDSSRTLL